MVFESRKHISMSYFYDKIPVIKLDKDIELSDPCKGVTTATDYILVHESTNCERVEFFLHFLNPVFIVII